MYQLKFLFVYKTKKKKKVYSKSLQNITNRLIYTTAIQRVYWTKLTSLNARPKAAQRAVQWSTDLRFEQQN